MIAASVIVPHLDDLQGLDRCLKALERQTVSPCTFEVLVIDNGSACGIAAVEACVGGRARVLVEERPGAGPARNRGASEAAGRILAFTDADCRPRPDWLERGMAIVRPDNFVGGGIIVTAADPARPTIVESYELAFAFNLRRYALKERFVATANMFTHRATFEAVGHFDDTLSEDTDWCWRALAGGFRLRFDPGLLVEHPARADWQALLRKQTRVTRERFYLGLRWGLSRPVQAARAVAALLLFPRELSQIRRVPARRRTAVLRILIRLRWCRCLETLKLALAGSPMRLNTSPKTERRCHSDSSAENRSF